MALAGIRVVEFAGLAPGPFAGLVLADRGADVIRVDRPGAKSADTLARHKRSIVLDVKNPVGLDLLKRLIARADVLIDPYRPGVLERLGLGPDVFFGEQGLNRRLIYARLAGFPPNGPHRDMAGHDINYLALSGILSMLPGDADKPSFPLNLLADFGGGGLACALGILLALIQRQQTGLGQVVSTDMVSGTRYLSSYPLIQTLSSSESRRPSFGAPFPLSPPTTSSLPMTRMHNTLDGGCPFYNVYTCADGRWMSVGCLEPQFYAVFLSRFLQALPKDFIERAFEYWKPSVDKQYRPEEWPKLKVLFSQGFKLFERDHWAAIFHGSDACALPILSPSEAALLASQTELAAWDAAIPMPHPVLSQTAAQSVQVSDASKPDSTAVLVEDQEGWLEPGRHGTDILADILGMNLQDIRDVILAGALGKAFAKL